jgi:uncharacterized membrane protein
MFLTGTRREITMGWLTHRGGGMDFYGYAIWFVVVAIYVGIPLVVLRLLVRAATRPRDDSRTILRRRFAKGEISQSEFEDAQRILGI